MNDSASEEPSEQTQQEGKEESQGACGTAADEKPGKGRRSGPFEPTLMPHIWPITTNTDNAMNQSKFDAKASNRPAPARRGKNAHYPNWFRFLDSKHTLSSGEQPDFWTRLFKERIILSTG